MAPTLEDRVSALEQSRYSMLGRMNAYQTLIITLWVNMIPKLRGDPVEIAELMRSEWLRGAERPVRDFPHADPVSLDLVGQIYRDAIEDLSGQIVDYFRDRESKGDTAERESDS